MFDLFAARYGYTIDQFYALTLRQIYKIKRVIEKKDIEEKEFLAKLHDKKTNEKFKPILVSREKRKEQDSEAIDLLKRLENKYQDGQRSRTTDKD